MKKFENGKIYTIQLKDLERMGFMEVCNTYVLYNKQIFRETNLKNLCSNYPIFIKYLGDNQFEEMLTGIRIKSNVINKVNSIMKNEGEFTQLCEEYSCNPLWIRNIDINEITDDDKKIFSGLNHEQLKNIIENVFNASKWQYEMEKSLVVLHDEEMKKITSVETKLEEFSTKTNKRK